MVVARGARLARTSPTTARCPDVGPCQISCWHAIDSPCVFWLYEWLDEHDVKKPEHALRLIQDSTQLERLKERAHAVPYTTEPLADQAEQGPVLLAGRGIDLSGDLDCFAWSCRKRQVDRLLSTIWHYFDQVVVVGPGAYRVAQTLESSDVAWRTDKIMSDVRLLLYLREIGAEPLVIFRQKPPPCEIHLVQHAQEVGLEHLIDGAKRLARQLEPDARVETEIHDDHFDYSFTHPRLEHTLWGAVHEAVPSGGHDLRIAVAESVTSRYMAHLTSDVQTARSLRLALGSTVAIHGDLLGLTDQAPSPADVAFHLSLPTLIDADVPTLLKVRAHEKEHFEKFRNALRAAIKEALKARDENAQSSLVIASEIEADLIRPALNDIALRLRTSQAALNKKKKLAAGVGAVITACGVMTAQPLLIAAGLSTGAAVLQAASKYVDEEREVQLSDMYFLWQAQAHADHR
jgi:hypothetical protein